MLLGMPRPRGFDENDVVVAAKDLFWRQGYLATSIGDVEEVTGLSRSSIYMAFGTKRGLFAASLRLYLETFIDPLLGPLEHPQADLPTIVDYFRALASRFEGPDGSRGCLMINTIGELAGSDAAFADDGRHFLERLRAAFSNALKRAVRADVMTKREAAQRAELLGGAAIGAWITARSDPAAARALCRATIALVESWAVGP
jgi:TetR/AcrR family transcriptional repressor of nem operon